MKPSKRIASRIIAILVAVGSLAFGALAVRAWAAGIPVYDPLLFPVMVALPALISAGLALSLFGSPGLRANIVLLGIALVAGLYVLETALVLVPRSADPLPAELALAEGRPFDTRSRLEVAADMRANGRLAYPAIGARALRSSPPLGPGIVLEGRAIAPFSQPANQTIVDCNESGRFAVFRSDERGYNNPGGSWQLPVTVAAVGDSYVQGSCVDPADNLVAGLRQGIPGTVGLGMADTGPLVMLGMIKEYLADVRPSDVVWFFYEGNDLRNLRSELESPELRQYLEPGRTQGLHLLREAIDSLVIEYLDELVADPPTNASVPSEPLPATVRLRRWIRLHGLRNTLGLADIGSRLQRCCDPDILESVLREADRTVRGWGGRLHFVYLPAAGRYAHPLSSILDDDLRHRGAVMRAVRRVGLPVVDMHAVFRATGDPEALVFNARSHFNPAGYRTAADAVVRHLEEQARSSERAPR